MTVVGLSKPWGWNTLCRLDKNKKKKLFVVITVLIKRAAVESQELHITDDPSGACNISALCREKTAAVWKKSQWPSQPPHHCCRLHCLWLQWLAKGDKMHQCISENICCMSWSQKKKKLTTLSVTVRWKTFDPVFCILYISDISLFLRNILIYCHAVQISWALTQLYSVF